MATINFSQFTKIIKTLETNVDSSAKDIQKFRDEAGLVPGGITPDAVKFSPEYRALKSEYARHFEALRRANAIYVKTFKNELREQRRQDRRSNP